MLIDKSNIILQFTCPVCKHLHVVAVDIEDYMEFAYENCSVRQAFPYLDRTEREQIISNLCPSCQLKIFQET